MTIVNLEERLTQAADDIMKKVKAQAKKKHVRIAYTDVSIDGKTAVLLIETDSPAWVLDEVKYDIIKKSKYAIFVSGTLHDGFFDWASDTYIKDSVSITIKV